MDRALGQEGVGDWFAEPAPSSPGGPFAAIVSPEACFLMCIMGVERVEQMLKVWQFLKDTYPYQDA